MTTCIATKKTDGKICGVKCKAGKLLCGRHDPEAQKERKPNSKKKLDREKLQAVFDKIAKKVNYVPSTEDIEQKRGKNDRSFVLQQLPAYMNKHTNAAMKTYALSGKDLKPYVGRFPRKVWMIISWHLSSDLDSYQNVAMSCQKLYDLFVRQKVTWYYHPLKGQLKSPKLYQFPIFRILEFHVPTDMDDLLKKANLPSVEDVIKQYDESDGKPKTELEAMKRRTEVILELSKTLIGNEMREDDEFEEEITGGGIFSNVTSAKKLKFDDSTIKKKVFKHGDSYYVIVMPTKEISGTALERKLIKSLHTYNGRSIIQLMRLD